MEGLPYKTWQLVEEKIVSGTSLGSYDFTVPLNGNADTEYAITSYIVNDNTGSASYSLRINSTAMAGSRQCFSSQDTTVAGKRDLSGTFCDYLLSTQSAMYKIDMPKSLAGSISRFLLVNGCFATGSPTQQLEMKGINITNPTPATNITSLGIECDIVSGLGLTTELRLYRVH